MPPAIALWIFCAAAGHLTAHAVGADPWLGVSGGLLIGSGMSLWHHWEEIKAARARAFQEMCEAESPGYAARAKEAGKPVAYIRTCGTLGKKSGS